MLMNGSEIKLFRKKYGLTQQELANIVKSSVRAVQSWEQNQRNITQSAISLMRIYEESMKNENDFSESEYMKEVTSRFFEVFEHLKKNKQIKTQDDLAKILNTNKQAISDLKAHRKKLSIENLFDLKKSYEFISLDFIILGVGGIEVDTVTISEVTAQLIKMQNDRIVELEQTVMLLKKEKASKNPSSYIQVAEPSVELKKKK